MYSDMLVLFFPLLARENKKLPWSYPFSFGLICRDRDRIFLVLVLFVLNISDFFSDFFSDFQTLLSKFFENSKIQNIPYAGI